MKYFFHNLISINLLIFTACQETTSKSTSDDVIDVATMCTPDVLGSFCPLNTRPTIDSIATSRCERELTLTENENSVCVSSGECSIQCELSLECDGLFIVTRESVTCIPQMTVQDCINDDIDFSQFCPENTRPDISSLSKNSCEAVENNQTSICQTIGDCSISCIESCEFGAQSILGNIVICNPSPSCGNGVCEQSEGDENNFNNYCEVDCRKVCTALSTKCEGDLLVRCNDLGQWDEPSICPNNQTCRESQTTANCVSITQEVCDGQDNDFDDRIDEDLVQNFELQTGICRNATQRCINGEWSSPQSPNNPLFNRFYEPQELSCDQVDNDCDGITDNEGNGPTYSLCCQNLDCLNINWVRIPAGSFTMGSNDASIFSENEMPAHQVTLQTFSMMKSEVTTEMYRTCVASGNCPPIQNISGSNYFQTADADYPVNRLPMNMITWNEALTFCQWAGAENNGDLPSEAQWEYAARRTIDGIFPWIGGPESLTCNRAHVFECPRPDLGFEIDVCSKTAGNTVDGLCDMIGNLREWVKDDIYFDYTESPTDGSAYCSNPNCYPVGAVRKITRGAATRMFASQGSTNWKINTAVGRYRENYNTTRDGSIGFRCIKR